MSPNSNTPLFPTAGVALAVADADFEPSTIFVGTGGVVSIIPANGPGTTPRPITIATGGVVPCLVSGIRASGTTASNLFRVW